MALPLIFSLLGSGLAGAGALGATGLLASPLIAGAIGSGLGTAIQEKDLGAGIRSGLTAGLLGGLGGALTGGAAGGAKGLLEAAPEGTQAGIRGLMSRMPTGFQPGGAMPQGFAEIAKKGLNQGVLTGAGIGAALPGAMQAMTPTMPEIKPQTGPGREPVPFNRQARTAPAGFRPGIDPEFQYFRPTSVPVPRLAEGGAVATSTRTGEPIETGLMGMMNQISRGEIDPNQMGGMGRFFGMAAQRIMDATGASAGTPSGGQPMQAMTAPTVGPEYLYSRMVPRMQAGGMLNYTPAGMDQPMRMQAGGIADMMPGAEREAAPMNDKDIVAESIRAIRGELPEQEAAIVLGQFLQTYGEEAFRKLVDDVQSGRAGAGGDMEGTVQGPGDGMDDLVPATMDDGSQDVLLSDGEFIVPADVVSGLGNGSTDAGAEELHRMMDRVRQERTGRTEQAPKVAAGGLMPA